MKKIIFAIIFIFASVFMFSESKIDDLMKSDAEIHSDLSAKKNDVKVSKEAYVDKVTGQAFLKNDNSENWVQIVEKSVIKEKMSVITMENSKLRIKTKDGVFINLGQKTKVYFETMKGDPKKEEISETGINLLWGKIYSNVKKKVESGGKYEVKTGSVVAGVRGTKFLVETEKNGKTDLTVYEGIVAAKKIDSDYEVLIGKGEKIHVREDGTFEEKMRHNEEPPEEEVADVNMVQKKESVSETLPEEEKGSTIKDNNIVNDGTGAPGKTSLKIIIK